MRKNFYNAGDMPRKAKFKLPKLKFGGENLGQRLSRLRKEAGYTQVELAKKMGLQQNLISVYETGRGRINAEMAVHFMKALGVSPDEFFALKGPGKAKRGPTGKLGRLFEKASKLPRRQREKLIEFVSAFVEKQK